jgi:acyl-CoA synthetase (NDP forming)
MKEGKTILDMGHIPVSKYPEQTAAMLSHLHRYTRVRTEIMGDQPEKLGSDSSHPMPINKTDPLSIVRSIGIPVPSYVLTRDIESIPTAITSLGNPIVVKLLSKQIVHKTDIGAIRLNVPKDKAESVAKEMFEQVQKADPSIRIDGILCMDMINTSEGLECIIGIKKEAALGTLIMFGIGGIFVEILKDVTFRFVPLTQRDAHALIEGLKSSALFKGVRGKPALDTNALIQALLSVSTFASQHPEITELDINPFVVFPKGVVALDCRFSV